LSIKSNPDGDLMTTLGPVDIYGIPADSRM
jgi:hypothetical protein